MDLAWSTQDCFKEYCFVVRLSSSPHQTTKVDTLHSTAMDMLISSTANSQDLIHQELDQIRRDRGQEEVVHDKD
eukprot:gene1306-biopygen8801